MKQVNDQVDSKIKGVINVFTGTAHSESKRCCPFFERFAAECGYQIKFLNNWNGSDESANMLAQPETIEQIDILWFPNPCGSPTSMSSTMQESVKKFMQKSYNPVLLGTFNTFAYDTYSSRWLLPAFGFRDIFGDTTLTSSVVSDQEYHISKEYLRCSELWEGVTNSGTFDIDVGYSHSQFSQKHPWPSAVMDGTEFIAHTSDYNCLISYYQGPCPEFDTKYVRSIFISQMFEYATADLPQRLLYNILCFLKIPRIWSPKKSPSISSFFSATSQIVIIVTSKRLQWKTLPRLFLVIQNPD